MQQIGLSGEPTNENEYNALSAMPMDPRTGNTSQSLQVVLQK